MNNPHTYVITVVVDDSILTDHFRAVRDATKDLASNLGYNGDVLAEVRLLHENDMFTANVDGNKVTYSHVRY